MHTIIIFLLIIIVITITTLGNKCKDPVTVVYHLTDGTDPLKIAADRGYTYLRKIDKMKINLHEFQIACADGHPGGHDVLTANIIANNDRKRRQQQQQIENDDIIQDFGVQSKHKRYPRRWRTEQWHLTADHSSADTHITAVWSSGITGNGSLIAIVDEGVAWNNVDLQNRFSMAHSKNYNSVERRNDPYPSSISDAHGTAAAGVAAASGRNGPPFDHDPGCAFGVAPMAQIAGIKLIAQPVSDITEAEALTHDCDEEGISIYSCSWGPVDNGEQIEGPGPITKMSINDCAKNGRNGKGSIYVWAAGNGAGRYDDSCAYDGYASHPDVISVGAFARDGVLTDYSEDCYAIFVVAPSSGHGSAITTTDVPYPSRLMNPACMSDFGGTSAAAPFVAGVIALILEANPQLTNNDVQWILASTSTHVVSSDRSWLMNAANFSYSPKYGFGLINADTAVQYAKNLRSTRLRPSRLTTFEIESDSHHTAAPLPVLLHNIVISDNFVVQRAVLTVSVTYPSRSELSFSLTSPSGTIATVRGRQYDTHPNLFGWSFTFLSMWGEQSVGTWKLSVQKSNNSQRQGTLDYWKLLLIGGVQ